MNKKHHPSNRAERLRLKKERDTFEPISKGLDHAHRRRVLEEEAEAERVILSKVIDDVVSEDDDISGERERRIATFAEYLKPR